MADPTPPVIEFEVVPPATSDRSSGGQSAGGVPPPRTGVDRTPFHPMAATLLLVVDNLWNLADWAIIDWIVTIPLSFLSVAIPTFVIQRKRQGDSAGVAFAKALFLGVIAAVPTSITGTPVGLALLTWAGINAARK